MTAVSLWCLCRDGSGVGVSLLVQGKTVADTLGETLRSLNEKAHDVADAAKRAVGLESEEEAKPAETRTGDYPSAPAGAEMQNKPHYDPEMEEDLHGKGP